jgi:hypothetical protein
VVGGNSEAQGFVRHRRRAAGGYAAQGQSHKVLEGNLESKTVCRPATVVFILGIRVAKSQMAGHLRPARGFAEHELKAAGEC